MAVQAVKPRLLDLFCGAGGAAVGYARAGFEVVGVDHEPQPNYPFYFIEDDALDYIDGLDPGPLQYRFTAIHASPPCQAYTRAQVIRKNEHADLVGPTRELLEATGLPWVIENVKRSPLKNPTVLEGQMFPDLRTHRPRWFETNWPLEVDFLRLAPPRNAKMGRPGNGDEWPQLVGHFTDIEGARRAMGIDWMTRDELREAIPPAYTELIGAQLLQHIKAKAVA